MDSGVTRDVIHALQGHSIHQFIHAILYYPDFTESTTRALLLHETPDLIQALLVHSETAPMAQSSVLHATKSILLQLQGDRYTRGLVRLQSQWIESTVLRTMYLVRLHYEVISNEYDTLAIKKWTYISVNRKHWDVYKTRWKFYRCGLHKLVR